MTKFNYKISYSPFLQKNNKKQLQPNITTLFNIFLLNMTYPTNIDYKDYNSPIKSYTLQSYLKGMENEKKKIS